MHQQTIGWAIFTLLISGVLTFPEANYVQVGEPRPQYYRHQQQPAVRIERKFAEKPNAIKKVAIDDVDDIQTNQISESTGGGGGFSWSSLLGMVMQMIFNPGGGQQGPNKSESLDDTSVAPSSPWANLLTVGLKILSALLGGGGAATNNDGIDKVDNGSPMQFINIVVNLLDALKTSFSHRSLAARHLGRKDSISDAAVASIAMMKGYVRSIATSDSVCMQKYMCQANTECTTDIGGASLFCQLGNYATSVLLNKSTVTDTGRTNMFEYIYDAGRRGRTGENCQQAYLACNEV